MLFRQVCPPLLPLSFVSLPTSELDVDQESNFYYLSGCAVPGSYLLLTYQHGTSLSGTPSVQLFIPEIDVDTLMWSVPPPTAEEATELFDVTRVQYLSALPDAIVEQLKAFPEAVFHVLPKGSPLFPTLPEQYIGLATSRNAPITDAYLLRALHQARLTKDDAEIALIQKANDISSRAHEVVMRVLGQAVKGALKKSKDAGPRPSLPGEWLIEKEAEAEAIFVASCRREEYAGCLPSQLYHAEEVV